MPGTGLGAGVTNTSRTSPLALKFSEQRQMAIVYQYKLMHEKTELGAQALRGPGSGWEFGRGDQKGKTRLSSVLKDG